MKVWRWPVRTRWWIFWYLFAFALFSYMQRTSVAVAADSIMPALHFSQMEIGWLNAAFTAAYAVAQLPGGVLGQRIGARWIYVYAGALSVAATIATPLAPALFAGTTLFAVLLVSQAVLGLSAGPLFPMFAAVAQSWFPVRQWCLVNGLQSAGMNIGGAITPIFIVMLTEDFGWQGAMLWLALPVAVLTACWGWYARDRPAQHRSVTPQELAELGPEAHETAPPVTLRRLGAVLGDRNVLLLSVSYLCMNYTFYLLSFWSFLYLVQERHFGGLESGLVGAVPWIGAGLGAGFGGHLSDRLAERFGARWGYRVVPLAALPLAGILLVAAIQVGTAYLAVAALTVAFFATEINEGAYWAATMRVARGDTAAAAGVLNTGGNLGGIITQPLVGALSAVGAWDAAFFTGTGFALVAAGCWLLIDAERQIRVPDQVARRAALVAG